MAASPPRHRHWDDDCPPRLKRRVSPPPHRTAPWPPLPPSHSSDVDHRRRPRVSPTDANCRRRSMVSPLGPTRRRRSVASPSGRDCGPSQDSACFMPSGDAVGRCARVSDVEQGGDRRRGARVSDEERADGHLRMRSRASDGESCYRRGKSRRRSPSSEPGSCPDDRCNFRRRRDDKSRSRKDDGKLGLGFCPDHRCNIRRRLDESSRRWEDNREKLWSPEKRKMPPLLEMIPGRTGGIPPFRKARMMQEVKDKESPKYQLRKMPPLLEMTPGRKGGIYLPPFRKARMMQEVKDKESPKYQLRKMAPLLETTPGRKGGIYLPPFRKARMMLEVKDKGSPEYQRLSWDALRKSIKGLLNKVNVTNIKDILPKLFAQNLVRGRGLFCRSCIRSQMTSPQFTDVMATLVTVVNTRFPEIGRLLLVRVVLQLKRALKENDMVQSIAATKFIAHLVNQAVAHENLALELLKFLLVNPTSCRVEVAVVFAKECGATLQLLSPNRLHAILERLKCILLDGKIDKRVQILIKDLFAIGKANFKEIPSIHPELNIVEEQDKFTHEISLEHGLDPETNLDFFRLNPNFTEDEEAHEHLKESIQGTEFSEDAADFAEEESEEQMELMDEVENPFNFTRTLHLYVMSSAHYEEAGLMKIQVKSGQEMELCSMILECCSQEKTYLRYYGLLAQRYCMMNKVYQENFEKCFMQQYSMAHSLETGKLTNIAKFYAHLLETDTLPWNVLACIRLTEETASSTRIFTKVLFQELSGRLGIRRLNERLDDPNVQGFLESIFPKDDPRNMKFSIDYFRAIGLGDIADRAKEKMTPIVMQQHQPAFACS